MSSRDQDRTPRRRRSPSRILVPIFYRHEDTALVHLAKAISDGRQVLVLGIVPVESQRPLSQAAKEARELRTYLNREVAPLGVRIWSKIQVTYTPAYEIAAFVTANNVDLLMLAHRPDHPELHALQQSIIDHCPCNLAIVRGRPERVRGKALAVLRAGADSEQALRFALRLAQGGQVDLTSLRPSRTAAEDLEHPSNLAMDQVMEHLTRVKSAVAEDTIMLTDEPVSAVLDMAEEYDLVIVGASADGQASFPRPDELAAALLDQTEIPVVVVRSRDIPETRSPMESMGLDTISILVDKWFAENTFHAEEFNDLARLVEAKQEQGLTISLALPALNEEETVANVILTIRKALVEQFPLLDEIVLIDSNSTDRTREIAESLGIPVHIHQNLLPEYGARDGKGEALWKSLYVTRGDLVFWIDTDIVNIHPRFVYGLVGPLLFRPDLMFIKGYYLRPIRVGNVVQAGGGGRVTELTARPLLNLFYPALSGLIQPLSGEYGGRRSVLESVPFSSGYGVEIGLLIDILETYGLGAIGQVDLIERIHHNQPLTALSKMSFQIIQTFFRKLDRRYNLKLLDDVNRTMKLIQHDKDRFYLKVEYIPELERPPMITLPEYRQRHAARLEARPSPA